MQQKVTQSSIDAAADAVVTAGGKPTFRLIQQRVGGSFTTIKPMLADWEARRVSGEVIPVDVPDALLAKGADLVRVIFAEVAQQARVEADAVRKDAVVQIATMKGELSEATEEIVRLEAQDSAKDEEITALKSANRDFEHKVERLEERVLRSAEIEVNLTESRSALAKAEQQVVDLHAQLSKAGDVQQQLANLEKRLLPGADTVKSKR